MNANESNTLKEIVKEKYGQIAEKGTLETGCCDTGCGCGFDNVMAEKYEDINGYVSDADLGLGCGLPTEFAKMKKGDTVVDLGSGAGNDAFVARSVVGENGKVIGIDFTEKMINKARINAEKLNYNNVEFRLGDIENMPLSNNVADVVVSNCVLNLVPEKTKAFSETFRILKEGGHFSVSDIVINGLLPAKIQQAAEMYVGCVSGAIQKEDYLKIIREAGFENITLQKEKKINVPDEVLKQYLSDEEIKQLKNSGSEILSITVYAEKPGNKNLEKTSESKSCCGPECCN